MDEQFVHQIPEPLPNVVTHHPFWRESLFFVLHPRDDLGDVVILTLAHFPARGEMDSLQLGRVGGVSTVARHARPYAGDPHTMAVGPVTIEIVEPFRTVHLTVAEDAAAPVALDLTFTARTREHALRRGTMKAGHEIIWDQSHMIQSGTYDGWYQYDGVTYPVNRWWGQRDHSWGIRDHARCPLWMWLAIQLPDGMIGGWHWEMPDGTLVFEDFGWCPTDGGDSVPATKFTYDLNWIDAAGNAVSYERDGEDVAGIAGRVDFEFADGSKVGIDATGRWAQRYGPVGGGLNEMQITTDDGRSGTAIYECTGAFHHHFFPVRRSQNLPGD